MVFNRDLVLVNSTSSLISGGTGQGGQDLHAGGVGAHTELHFTLIFKKTKQIRNSKKRHNKEEGQEFSIEQFGR